MQLCVFAHVCVSHTPAPTSSSQWDWGNSIDLSCCHLVTMGLRTYLGLGGQNFHDCTTYVECESSVLSFCRLPTLNNVSLGTVTPLYAGHLWDRPECPY